MTLEATVKVVGVIILVATLLWIFSWLGEQGEITGLCKCKGFDGKREINGILYCIKIEEGTLVGVPLETLKGE